MDTENPETVSQPAEPTNVRQQSQQSASEEKKSNKKLYIALGCLVLIIVVPVLGFICTTAGFFALNPTELFDEARYTTAKQDVDAMASGLRQMLIRDFDNDMTMISDACLNGAALPTINIVDDIDPTEGGDVTMLARCMSSYISQLPAPQEGFVYRWGVEGYSVPKYIFIGLTAVSQDDEELYPDYYYIINNQGEYDTSEEL